MIDQRVKQLISSAYSVPLQNVTNDAELGDNFDMDSLDRIELVIQLEDEFGIEIQDEDAEKVTTVQAAIDCVVKYSPVGAV